MGEEPTVSTPPIDAALARLAERHPTAGGDGTPRPAPVTRSGVDLVAISRIRDLLDEFGASFRERVYTTEERRYCESRASPAQHYAARWAAKEAFAKALGDGVAPPPRAAVEAARTDDSPAPELDLAPDARDALDRSIASAGGDPARSATSLSLSHDREADRAVAQLVVVAPRPEAGDE